MRYRTWNPYYHYDEKLVTWVGKLVEGVVQVGQEIDVPDAGSVEIEVGGGVWASFTTSEWASMAILGKPTDFHKKP